MRIFKRDSVASRAIALLMGALLATSTPLTPPRVANAAARGKYVSDVRVGVGSTDKEAIDYLEGEGYSIVGYEGGHRREDADESRFETCADLNEGGDALLKSTRKVFLGYKTTDDPAEAVTDLAVMGMDGGYSFSSYAQLMDKYRDQTVRPLQEQVMRMVKEYRDNADSDDAGARARAEMARTQLNMIVDDDTDEHLGDLLLRDTSQEMGATPSTMDAAAAVAWRAANPGVLDLECALMQGNVDIVRQMEILLASACDGGETTWLERLSKLGPNGLKEQFADLPPTDARREMDSLYQDAATKLAESWNDFATDLAEADERIGSEFDEEIDQDDADDEGVEDLDEPEMMESDKDEAALPDLGDSLFFDIEEPEELKDVDDMTEEDIENMVSDMAESEQAALDTFEATKEFSVDSIYRVLRVLPFGDGSLYDYFTMSEAEAATDGAYALYPIVAVLTDGQLASINFQSLASLVRQGATTNDVCQMLTSPESNFLEAVSNTSKASLYQGVKREIFSDLSALTSEALRKDVLNGSGAGSGDLGTRHVVAITTACIGIASFVAAGVINAKATKLISTPVIDAARLETLKQNHALFKQTYPLVKAQHPNDLFFKITQERIKVGKNAYKPGRFTVDFRFPMKKTTSRGGTVIVPRHHYYHFDADSGLSTTMETFEEADQALTNAENNPQVSQVRVLEDGWRHARNALIVAGVILAIFSLACEIAEIYDYFNVDYTPIPKYIVDERDITEVTEDGTVLVTRNDAAYYEVARTNRKADAKHAEALRDFADLNGDGGKGWVALYVGKDPSLQPILADSLAVVVGTTSVPDGYVTGIHEFGTDGAANLCDKRYSYRDSRDGIYAYFMREEPEIAAETGSVFASGAQATSPVIVGVISLAAGAAAGSAITYVTLRRRKDQ